MGKGASEADCRGPVTLDAAGPPGDRELEQLHTFRCPDTGLAASVRDIERFWDGMVAVRGVVHDRRGDWAGRYDFYWQNHGRTLRVESVLVDPEHQGGGFGRRWLDQLETRWAQRGVQEINLLAQHVGSYMWAQRGFRFQNQSRSEDGEARVARYLLSTYGYALEDLEGGGFVDAEHATAFRARFSPDAADRFVTPAQIAAFGRERPWRDRDGHELWLGKAFLMRCDWRGLKPLAG